MDDGISMRRALPFFVCRNIRVPSAQHSHLSPSPSPIRAPVISGLEDVDYEFLALGTASVQFRRQSFPLALAIAGCEPFGKAMCVTNCLSTPSGCTSGVTSVATARTLQPSRAPNSPAFAIRSFAA